MDAMIFAAGIGSRLKPFTDHHPKALASVAGKTALEHAISAVRDVPARKVVINTHHFADQIHDFISSHDFGIETRISDESDLLLDTGGGLLKAAGMFDTDDGKIILHNADIITDLNLVEMADFFRRTNSDVVLLTDPARKSTRQLWFDKLTNLLKGWSNVVSGETKPDGFHPAEKTMIPASFGGIHIINLHKVLPELEQYAALHGPVFSLTPFYLWASERLTIRSYIPSHPYKWHDIGTPAKLEAAEKDFA